MQHLDPKKFDVTWRPIDGTSQAFAVAAPVNHLLLTGGRGWGKTECQLMRFRSRVGMGYGSYWRGIIFDREYKNLDDLVMKSKRLFKALDVEDATFLSSNSDFKWKWKTGEELLFRVAKDDDDYWAYHGHEYPFVGWNELTKYPTGSVYRKMMSVNRTGFDADEHTPRLTGDNYISEWNRLHPWGHYLGRPFMAGDYETADGRALPPIPLEFVSTTNPYGPGHNWVKEQFIDAAPYGRVVRKQFNIFNPKTKQDEIITRTQATIFGSYRENPYLSPEYIAGLHEETDENILKAWIHGNWDIVAGGALDDKWKKHIHVVPRFKVPSNWYVDRAFDWGSTHPFSVGWWAESNGEEVELPDGTTRSWPVGTLIQIAEWYGTKRPGSNEGLKLSAKDVATGIVERETAMIKEGWIAYKANPGPADNQISDVRESDTETIEKKMSDNGVRWTTSDKSKGSRKNGLQLIRDRLQASIEREGAGLVFMDNCRASISTLPVLPRDDKNMDDVDTTAEDHAYDQVRYRVLKGNDRTAKVIAVNFFR